jgi:hypothetical protein
MTYSQTTKTLKVQTLLTPMGEIERPRPMTQYFSYYEKQGSGVVDVPRLE